jgi:hypothetical protein
MKDAVPNPTDLPSFCGTRTGLEVEDIKQSFLDNLKDRLQKRRPAALAAAGQPARFRVNR